MSDKGQMCWCPSHYALVDPPYWQDGHLGGCHGNISLKLSSCCLKKKTNAQNNSPCIPLRYL